MPFPLQLAHSIARSRCVRAALRTAAGACLLAACFTGCSAATPAPRGGPASPAVVSAPDLPVITRESGEGARWVDLGMTSGPDGHVLAGRFSVLAPPFLASRTVLVQGRDAHGALLFENRTLAWPTSARTTRNHHAREEGFSLLLPSAPGLQSLSVTVPARTAAD